ncbi:unnamed protein product [Caenorhabditis sp. 36 PRJEB53466]|nr:unnamed protein product [Caenorhabditis sp. 36 PRJEB53466]
MNSVGASFLILVAIIIQSSCEECHISYVNSFSEEVRSLECGKKDCTFEIVATSDRPVRLGAYVPASFDGYLSVWETISQNGKKELVSRGIVKNMEHYVFFISQINAGLIFQFHSESTECIHENLPNYAVSHESSSEQFSCEPIVNVIGNEVKTIQHSKSVPVAEACTYRLIPEFLSTTTEKLYLLITGDSTSMDHLLLPGEKPVRLPTTELLVFDKWSETDIVIDTDKNQEPKVDQKTKKITAISSNRLCSSGSTQIHEQTSFQSPGYPDFLCPDIINSVQISFGPKEIAEKDLARTYVSLNASSLAGVKLRFKSSSHDFVFDANSFSKISTHFLLKNEDLQIEYSTPKLLYKGNDGQFSLNVSSMIIDKDCDCSTFFDKMYSRDWSGSIRIPSHCETLFCSWTFNSDPDAPRKLINIVLENGNADDEVHFWDRTTTLVYKGDELKYPRTFYSADSSHNAHILFWRFTNGSDSLITVSWHEVKDVQCEIQQHVLLSTSPLSFASPNYPLPYDNHNVCEYQLKALENHTITVHLDDISVEKIHDHLSFYDGRSEDYPLLGHFTGKLANITLSSSGDTLLVKFKSDAQNTYRGYHFVAFSVPEDIPTIIQTSCRNMYFCRRRTYSPMLSFDFVQLIAIQL